MTAGGSPISFNNAATGILEVQSGVLYLNGSGTHAGGTFNISAGAELQFASDQTLAGTYTGSGAGTVAIIAGTLTGDARAFALEALRGE